VRHDAAIIGRDGTRALASIKDYIALTKPGIVAWLVITAYCAMIVARGALPGLGVTVLTLGGLALVSGGAHAVNMWYDADIDRVMQRTAKRPVAAGRMPAVRALWFGIAALVVGVPLMGLGVNWVSAGAALAGYLFYIFVYTMWLKRRTPQNIVIGGAAGAFPPIVGWTAISPHWSWAPVLMFLMIFLWTPPHFWALALYKADDYRRAKVPMMPVARGPRTAKWQSLIYAVLLTGASVGLYATGAVGPVYLAVALALGLGFIGYTLRLLLEPDDRVAWARRTFRFSLLYVVAVFAAMVVNVHR
jgi:protoheme IX farnesyltransferase